MSTVNEEKEKKAFKSRVAETWDKMKSFEIKRFRDYIGPTGIWIITYYLTSIFIMIVMNIARVGWSGEAIFAAPSYFAQLFLNYGLNAGKVPAESGEELIDFYFEKLEFGRPLISASWIFAPMIIYVLGLMISFLPGSGYPAPEGYYILNNNFMYFHERTVLLNDHKTGGFYFVLVWIPIIMACFLGAFISKRIYKDPNQYKSFNVVKVMLFSLIPCLIVSYAMAKMTGEISFSFFGAIKTIFTNSYENYGFFFTGQYHPNALLFTSWFINLIPTFIAALWYNMYHQIEDSIIRLFTGKEKLPIPENVVKE
ncbi:MAG TPA: hypothetical protein VMX55_02525 [candidate division Zixibacteria bacterium]|nr:hypothetical protein [candidate division Zixibacteria bacterium]